MEVDGGTLFVDEFAALSESLQVIFLSVLEGRAVEKVGGESFTPDVRCIFATNADLATAIETGGLRRDLLGRVPSRILIPPLSDRRGDVFLLAKRFAGPRTLLGEVCRRAAPASLANNVRELAQRSPRRSRKKGDDGANEIDVRHVDLPDSVLRAGAHALGTRTAAMSYGPRRTRLRMRRDSSSGPDDNAGPARSRCGRGPGLEDVPSLGPLGLPLGRSSRLSSRVSGAFLSRRLGLSCTPKVSGR